MKNGRSNACSGEGGGELNDALLRAGLVDEVHLTVCPKIFGGRHAPTVADGAGAKFLAQATKMKIQSARRIGDELFLMLALTGPNAAGKRGKPGTSGS